MPETITETAFANSILEWAGVYGWRRFHVRNSGFGGKSYVQGDKGFPDLVLIKHPRMIFAELKIGTKKPTTDQHDWLDAIVNLALGIEVYVWRPSDWTDLLRILGDK